MVPVKISFGADRVPWFGDYTKSRNAAGTTATRTSEMGGRVLAVDLDGEGPGAAHLDLRGPYANGSGGAGGARRSRAGAACARRSRRPSSYTWTSALPSPGCPRGTTSRPRRNCPLAITTVVARPLNHCRPSRSTSTSGSGAATIGADRVRSRARTCCRRARPGAEGQRIHRDASVATGGTNLRGGRPTAAGEVVRGVRDERARAHRGGGDRRASAASPPVTSMSGARRRRAPPRFAGPDHRRDHRGRDRDGARCRDDPRRHLGRAAGGRRGLRLECHVGDLARAAAEVCRRGVVAASSTVSIPSP